MAFSFVKTHRQLFSAALVAVAVGCGKHDAGSSTKVGAAATAAAPGGELLFAFDGASLTQFPLDPHNSLYAPHHRIMRSIFDGLVVSLPEHRFGPWLAKSWDIAADGRSYTFHLRDDVKFHDGTRFDARAVKVNLDRIKDPKNALYAATDIGPYHSSTVVDDFTIRIEFATSFAPFLANLSKTNLGIISPAALETYGEQVQAHPVGTGPFKFKSLDAGTEIRLERNADYRWAPEGAAHQGPAWLERLVFRNVPEEATRVAVLQSGQAGVADLIPPQNLAAMRKSPDFHLSEGELLNHNYSLYLNVTRAPWDDLRARSAFKLSLDIDAAVQTIYFGTVARAWSPISPSVFAYDKTLEGSWKPDREGAARVLDELGWRPGTDGVRVKNGQRLSLAFLDTQGNREKRLDLMTVFRKQLRDNGIELHIDSVPLGTYMAKAASGDYDLLGASQFAPDPDVLRRIYTPSVRALSAVSKVNDSELNQTLEAGYQEGDVDARAALYHRAQHVIVDKAYSIPIYVLKYNIGAANRVHDVRIDVHGFPVFYDAWIAP